MNIIVLVKQVPDTTEIRVDKVTGTLIRTGVPSIINPDDLAGIEEALKLKDCMGAHVTAVTMGPPQCVTMLRELMARGVDETILVTDPRFAGADTWATSNTIAAVLKTLSYDLIIAGRQAIDGDTAQVGPQVAEKLGIPQVTYVSKIECESNNSIIVYKNYETRTEKIKAPFPLLITTLSDMNKPRYMNCEDIVSSFDKEIKIINLKDIEIDLNTIGLKGSPTKVKRTFNREVSNKSEQFFLEGLEASEFILKTLKDQQLIH